MLIIVRVEWFEIFGDNGATKERLRRTAFYDENVSISDRRGCSRDDQTSLVMLWQLADPRPMGVNTLKMTNKQSSFPPPAISHLCLIVFMSGLWQALSLTL